MRKFALTLLLMSFICGCADSETAWEKNNPTVKPPKGCNTSQYTVVRYYYCKYVESIPSDAPFRIRENGSYTLTHADGTLIRADIHYVKTFGGDYGAIRLYCVNSRFLYYPETIPDSEIRGKMFYPMLGKTNIYDLQERKLIWSSPPYEYTHDVPVQLILNPIRDED